MSETSRAIKRIRIMTGQTQGDLAAAVGVSSSAVKEWEAGRNGISPSNLEKIRSFLTLKGWDENKIESILTSAVVNDKLV